MKIKRPPTKLEKKAKRGDRGYPTATVAFYGPAASRASKVAVGILPGYDEEVTELARWSLDTADLLNDPTSSKEILAFIPNPS